MGIADVLLRIKAVVGPAGWVADPNDEEPYLVEARRHYRGATRLVVRPGSTEEVAAVVEICAGAGLAVVLQGGNTDLVGGGVPPKERDNIVLALGRMNRVRAIDPVNFTMTVEVWDGLRSLRKDNTGYDLKPLFISGAGTLGIIAAATNHPKRRGPRAPVFRSRACAGAARRRIVAGPRRATWISATSRLARIVEKSRCSQRLMTTKCVK